MAGMFYSIKEVAEKLGKSEDEVRQLVKAGQLREFRDGPNLLFKVDEVSALLSDTTFMAKQESEKPAAPKPQSEAEAEEILLAPETPSEAVDSTPSTSSGQASSPQGEKIEVTDADTQIVDEGIKILGDTDTAGAIRETGDETFKGLEETQAPASKEASLEEIEKDVSLDTFGSGSGLLDLSLQADDTSLGGILDEIYTPGGEGKPAAAPGSAEGSAMEVAAEADQMLSEAQFPEPQVQAGAIAAGAYIETEPDAISNAMGVMLFIPLLAVIYTAIVAVAGFSFVMPMILKSVQSLIWYVAIGLAVVSILITGVGAMMGREKTPKAPKPPKPPKVKKEKPPKPVKEKKAK
jgi:excisionase family DNA binding protein